MIKFNKSIQKFQEEYPTFKKLAVALILEALQKTHKSHQTAGKLDLQKFYPFLKGAGSMYRYNKTFEEMKETISDISPILGITDQIRFSREEKSDIKFRENAIDGGLNMSFFDDARILPEFIEESDTVVRSMDGDCEPAFYRFDKKLSVQESNMLRISYAYTNGNPAKNLWTNYMEAVPAKVGFVISSGRSFESTRGISRGNKI